MFAAPFKPNAGSISTVSPQGSGFNVLLSHRQIFFPQASMFTLMASPIPSFYMRHLDANTYLFPTIVSFLPNYQVHDWLILFDREVEHIWKKEWNIPKILFIVSRYGLLLDMPLMVTCESDFVLTYWAGRNANRWILLLEVRISPYGTTDYNVCINIVGARRG